MHLLPFTASTKHNTGKEDRHHGGFLLEFRSHGFIANIHSRYMSQRKIPASDDLASQQSHRDHCENT